VLSARPLTGHPTPSDESSHVTWVPTSELTEYDMDTAMRCRIANHLNGVTDYLD